MLLFARELQIIERGGVMRANSVVGARARFELLRCEDNNKKIVSLGCFQVSMVRLR